MFKNNQRLLSLSKEEITNHLGRGAACQKTERFWFFSILGIVRNATSYPTAEGKLIASIKSPLSREASLTLK